MISDIVPLGERVFSSADVSRLAGVSLRQLQWWDERKLVPARMEEHRRVYLTHQVLEILAVAALRRKGVSLQKTRRLLRLLRRELDGIDGGLWSGNAQAYLVTDASSLAVTGDAEQALSRIARAAKPMYVVSLGDEIRHIVFDQGRQRHRTSQLRLFEDADA